MCVCTLPYVHSISCLDGSMVVICEAWDIGWVWRSVWSAHVRLVASAAGCVGVDVWVSSVGLLSVIAVDERYNYLVV